MTTAARDPNQIFDRRIDHELIGGACGAAGLGESERVAYTNVGRPHRVDSPWPAEDLVAGNHGFAGLPPIHDEVSRSKTLDRVFDRDLIDPTRRLEGDFDDGPVTVVDLDRADSSLDGDPGGRQPHVADAQDDGDEEEGRDGQ